MEQPQKQCLNCKRFQPFQCWAQQLMKWKGEIKSIVAITLRARLDVMSHGELGPNACFPSYPFTQTLPSLIDLLRCSCNFGHSSFYCVIVYKRETTGERLVRIMIKINAHDFHHKSPLAILPLPGLHFIVWLIKIKRLWTVVAIGNQINSLTYFNLIVLC